MENLKDLGHSPETDAVSPITKEASPEIKPQLSAVDAYGSINKTINRLPDCYLGNNARFSLFRSVLNGTIASIEFSDKDISAIKEKYGIIYGPDKRNEYLEWHYKIAVLYENCGAVRGINRLLRRPEYFSKNNQILFVGSELVFEDERFKITSIHPDYLTACSYYDQGYPQKIKKRTKFTQEILQNAYSETDQKTKDRVALEKAEINEQDQNQSPAIRVFNILDKRLSIEYDKGGTHYISSASLKYLRAELIEVMAGGGVEFFEGDFTNLAQRYGEKKLWFISKNRMEKIYQIAAKNENLTAMRAINAYLERPLVVTSDDKPLAVGIWFHFGDKVLKVTGINSDGSVRAAEYDAPGLWNQKSPRKFKLTRADLKNTVFIGDSIYSELRKKLEASGRYFKDTKTEGKN